MKTITGTWNYPDATPVANGVLYLKLSQDAVVNGTAQIAPRVLAITLNGSGQIPAATQIFANDELTPSGTFYRCSVVAVGGGLVWGEDDFSITGASPINLNNLVPVVSAGSPIYSQLAQIALQVNGTPNGSQIKLNLKNGTNVTITDDGVGGVTVNAATPTTLSTAVLQHQAVIIGTSAAWSTVWQLFTTGQVFGNNATASAPTATLPRLWNGDTNVGATQPAYASELTKEFTLGLLNSWIMKCRMLNFATVGPQFWTGVSDLTPSALNFATATPAANFVGFRLVTPETTWKCVCQTDAAHQTIVDTAITADTNLHKFAIQPTASGTSINFYIDGVKVATIATNVPANSVPLLTMVYAYDTIGLPNITLSLASFYWDTLF